MRSILLLIGLLFYISAHAQMLSEKEAIQYANQLHAKQILTEKGTTILLNAIQENTLVREYDGYTEQIELSKANILGYCVDLFHSDLIYRTGLPESAAFRANNPSMLALNQDVDWTDKKAVKAYEKAQKRLQKTEQKKMNELLKTAKGPQIEAAIEAEVASKKYTSSYSFSFSLFGNLGRNLGQYEVVHPNRSVLGKTWMRTLEDIYAIGLIAEKTYQEAKKLPRKSFPTELHLIDFLAERTTFLENYVEIKAKELAFIDSLFAVKLLSETGKRKLIAAYEPYELKSVFDMLAYCENARVFDLTGYENRPQEGVELVLEELKTILPDFDYTNLKVEKIASNNPRDEDMVDLLVQFTTPDFPSREYSSRDFLEIKNSKHPRKHLRLDLLHRAINKWLADKNEERRLYYANDFTGNGVYGSPKFGYILMTKKQYETWEIAHANYFIFDDVTHDNQFNSVGIENILKTYETLGLFKHLNAEELEQGSVCIAQSKIQGYHDIIACFPKMVVFMDGEMGDLYQPYRTMTKELETITRGALKVTNIVDDFNKSSGKKTTNYSFAINGKTYETTLRVESDWYDFDFMILLEKAMKENNIDGKWYSCYGLDGLIFLTEEQHNYLEENQPDLLKWF